MLREYATLLNHALISVRASFALLDEECQFVRVFFFSCAQHTLTQNITLEMFYRPSEYR